MKKILFLIIALSSTLFAQAQLSVSVDTFRYSGNRNGIAIDPKIVVTNKGTTAETFVWNSEPGLSIIPSGFSVSGVCTNPGNCYNFSNASHSVSIPAGTTLEIYPTVTIGLNARLDSNCIIVINSNVQQLVWNIKAVQFPSSIATKPLKISIDMYPQPASNILNIVHNSSKVSRAVVFNVLGKKMEEYNTPFGAIGFSIPVNQLPNGMYIIDVRDAQNNSLSTQRFYKN